MAVGQQIRKTLRESKVKKEVGVETTVFRSQVKQKHKSSIVACLPFSDPPSSRHLGDDVSRRPTDDKVKKSSVCPIRSPPSSPSARRPAGGGTEKAPQQGSKQERPSKCQVGVSLRVAAQMRAPHRI